MTAREKKTETPSFRWQRTLRSDGDWVLYSPKDEVLAHVFMSDDTPGTIRVAYWRADNTNKFEDVHNTPIEELKNLIMIKAKMGALR